MRIRIIIKKQVFMYLCFESVRVFYNYNKSYLFRNMNKTNQKAQKWRPQTQHQEKQQHQINRLSGAQQMSSNQKNKQQTQVTQGQKEQLKEQAKIDKNQQNMGKQNKGTNLDELSQKEKIKTEQLQFIRIAEQKRVEYIKAVEFKREEAFKLMRHFISQQSKLILTHQKQIKQTIEQTKQSVKEIKLKQQINNLKISNMSLQGKLKNAQKEIVRKDELLKEWEDKLKRLEAIYLDKEQQKQNQIEQLQNKYQYIKESYQKQTQSLRANQDLKLKQGLQNLKKQYEAKLNKRFESEQKILQQKTGLENTLQQIEYLFQQSKRKIQNTSSLLQKSNLKLSIMQIQNKSMQKKIEELTNEKNNSFIQIQRIKQPYEQKYRELFQNYKKYRQGDKACQQKQINVMLSNKDSEIREIHNKSKCTLKSKQDELRQLRQQNKGLITQNKTFDQQLKKKKIQIDNIQEIVKQIKRIFPNKRGQNIHDIKQISKQIQILINQAQRYKDQKRQSDYLAQHLSQICKLNHENLKNIRDKLSSGKLNKLQRIPQDKNNPNHYGALLNSIFDKIKQDILNQQKSQQTQSSQLSKMNKHIQQLKKQLQVKNIAQNKLTQKNSKLEIQIYNLGKQNQLFKIEIATLKRQKIKLLQTRGDLQLKTISHQSELIQQKALNQDLVTEIQRKQKEYQEKVKQLQDKNKQLISQLQIATNQTLLKQELVQSLNNKTKQLQQKIKTSQLKNNLLQAQKNKLRDQMSQNVRMLRNEQDQMLDKISRTTEEVFEKKIQNKNTDSIILFIRQYGSCSTSNISFTVSEILQKMPKQRTFLIEECCKFFGVNYISTKLSFKYDEWFKNFSEYLPTPPKEFLFAVIMKTKKDVVFGVISDSVGKESKALAFNLKTRKIMKKSQRAKASSTSYENSMLKFGNDEIVIRNNSSLNIRVNTMILGERYFEFSKEDLVGKETGETVELQSFQIHKIIAV